MRTRRSTVLPKNAVFSPNAVLTALLPHLHKAAEGLTPPLRWEWGSLRLPVKPA